MNKARLQEHIRNFMRRSKSDAGDLNQHWNERREMVATYQSYTKERLLKLSPEELYEYLAPLWAMLMWGNKHHVVDKLIENNGMEGMRRQLADLVWGDADIGVRWDRFRSSVKGMGPAMVSEILCKTHPESMAIWNSRAKIGFNYLGIAEVPRYDYQVTGKIYKRLCAQAAQIADEMKAAGFEDASLLAVDYFIWGELQIEEAAGQPNDRAADAEKLLKPMTGAESEFIHNDIRDKVRDIGQWLGFDASMERKVADGSVVDTVWEATIGNMGRVIYVFEVQTKGSVDSLIVNLLKSLNNPAVQGIVAVSDRIQLEKIRKHASGVPQLREKLKFWDYKEVLRVHENLQSVNESINNLGLVPQGF